MPLVAPRRKGRDTQQTPTFSTAMEKVETEANHTLEQQVADAFGRLSSDINPFDEIAEDSKGASMFDFVDATLTGGRIKVKKGSLKCTAFRDSLF